MAGRAGGKDPQVEGASEVGASSREHAARMATPARAESMTVEQLLEKAREGRVRLPSFQRPLRWKAKDKRDLLDSMERGYPVGTLLLWKRSASADDIGAALPDAPARPGPGDVFLVIDGQQRIATLWEALGHTPAEGAHGMVFELPSEQFQYRLLTRAERNAEPPTGGEPPALPLHFALDATALSEWVPPELPREVKRRYFEVGKRLRQYPVPVYIVEGDDVDVLREIFDRTNSTGKALSRDDVFDALVGSKITDGDSAGLDLVNAQIADLGFGRLDRSTILKSFEAVRGGKIGKTDPRMLEPAGARAILVDTAHALRGAIAFVQSAGVPHVAVLPYELPLVVLARLFAKHPTPSERSRVLLRRWLWRGSIAEKLGGASASLQQHVDDIGEDEHDSVQALLRRTGQRAARPERAPNVENGFSVAHARGKLILCALWSRIPRSLVDGEKLVASDLFDGAVDEVLRRIVPAATPELGRSVANRLLHPRGGANAARLIVDCLDEGALASHGIDSDSRDLLREGRFGDFLARRAAVLDAWITELFDARAEWERDDAPPVEAIASRRAAS